KRPYDAALSVTATKCTEASQCIFSKAGRRAAGASSNSSFARAARRCARSGPVSRATTPTRVATETRPPMTERARSIVRHFRRVGGVRLAVGEPQLYALFSMSEACFRPGGPPAARSPTPMSGLVLSLSGMAIGDVLTELEGKKLIPPLVRTVDGWAEPRPDPCLCGRGQLLVGWAACSCRDDAVAPGHRTWECSACGHRVALGCRGSADPGPMEAYGCGSSGWGAGRRAP